ncbi:uncharacterized protein STEHIDRAFT_163789 [Stereum hirsutum FP-91666 SS1]|uniref:Uncharacterized protein n=1 Tax=Stereum hirsutum (strain FP-91666) TaxID=721885 RepID=R7RVS9_STEHR|nr:uncharacterized protein STEHIDRAFT_163789 [Stereum hirsutum FP-91666 SS1]EIM79264.1 hypothetical protein STEHIDRAFT_163789 [Stereum hirsutum FP-91666 SS1]
MLYSTHFDVHVQQDPSEDNAGRVARIRLWLQTSSRLDPQRYSRVRDLADALLDGFLDSGGLDDINEILASYFRRFGQSEDLRDVEEAIALQNRSIELTPDGHLNPHKPTHLEDLGNTFMNRFELLGNADDIDQCILSHSHAIALTGENGAYKPGQLHNLGNALITHNSSTLERSTF